MVFSEFLSCLLSCTSAAQLSLWFLSLMLFLIPNLVPHCLSVTDFGSCLDYFPAICSGALVFLHLVPAQGAPVIWPMHPRAAQIQYCLQHNTDALPFLSPLPVVFHIRCRRNSLTNTISTRYLTE